MNNILNIWKSVLSPNILTKILFATTLALVAITLYHNQVIERKNLELKNVELINKQVNDKLLELQADVEFLQRTTEAAKTTTKELNAKVSELEKKKSNYTDKVKELGNKDENVKNFLDTKLPDDLKRLLNESIPTKY